MTTLPMEPLDKARLFRSIFRGRPDVFPKLWINAAKKTKGYAPACSNEWKPGICEKPRVKCGECPNQAFIAVGDQVVLDHLQGRHVIGTYPLLEDVTCWFLAADFDKGSWMDDVAAFADTCRDHHIPASVERSRSGNGAHVWLFFSSPIPASTARRMGCFLVTETMARRHQLGMESYDRFFPNQDTMPRGGFGNLIALPLQHGPRQQGNTVFVDQQFVPYPDQWAYLASVMRIEPTAVNAIAQEAMRHDYGVGIPFSEPLDDEEKAKPWTRSPSGRPRKIRITGALPAEIKAVVAQRLFIEKTGLPSSLLNQIKRLAAFQNPEFYKKQKMRLSTALTPRVIACAEDLPNHIVLPRGCRSELEKLLSDLQTRLEVDDQRTAGESLDVGFRGELNPIQEQAVQAMLPHDIGVLVAPPGVGKTVLGAYLVAQRTRSTLILVHRTALLDQWRAQLALFLGIHPKDIGQLGGGKRKPNGHLDVAMIQALVRKGAVSDQVARYGHVIVDECHHLPAVSFERVLSEVKARFLVGLTATPQRRDGHHPITSMQLGPVRFTVDPKKEAARRTFSHRLIVRDTAFRVGEKTQKQSIQDLYKALATDQYRNQHILNDVISALRKGRSPILLSERRDHLDYFARELLKITPHVVTMTGGMSGKARARIAVQLASIPDHAKRIILATGRYIGEGFDDARLDTLFLTLPISWKGTLVQYTGRLHRQRHQKIDVQVFDYVDCEVPVLQRMFEKRLRTYHSLGYERSEAWSGSDENTRFPKDPLSQEAPVVKLPIAADSETHDSQSDIEFPKQARPQSFRRPENAKVKRPESTTQSSEVSPERLDELIEEVTVDCYGESEQVTAFFALLEERLELPFETQVLGVDVEVEGLDLNERETIIALCVRGSERQAIPLLRLPLPTPRPHGAEWIDAFRHWARGR